jgi:4-diphosphocytidyl-2-C-methyl-D-erythritol kinase
VVVVRPPEGLSTPDVYRRCQPADKPLSAQALLADLARGDLASASRRMVNRLQAPAASLSPWIDRLSREFSRLDCLGHQMSGSGSSYFGICRNAPQARRLASQLRSRKLGNIYCTTTA